MRILMTTDTVGGVWTFTQELVAGLLERGCSIRLISFGRLPSAAQREQCDALVRAFSKRFTYVASVIGLEWMEENGRVLEQGSELLKREAAAFSPDLIHSSQFCYGSLGAHYPCVVTAHSDVLSWARGCRPEGLPESQWLERYVAMVQAGLLAANAVVAPTKWMLEALAESFAIPRCACVVPNGRSVKASAHGVRELRAVTAGRLWDEGKGISTLAGIASPLPIDIAGELPDVLSADWMERRELRWMGHLTEPEMLRLLQARAIYLCLSKYEPFGLAALEAALCGCAIVARDMPSLREVWREGALYFGDERELSELLRRLSDDPSMLRRAQMTSCGRAQLFTRDRMVDGYLGVFGSVLQGTLQEEHAA